MSRIDGGLRKLFHSNLRIGFHWQAIETGGTGLGIPDSNWASGGLEGWVEFKLTGARAVGLSPEQVGWLDRRARCGGRVHVAVRRQAEAGSRRVACDELWLLRGADSKLIKAAGLVEDAAYVLGRWAGGPASWRWDIVADLLRS